MSKNLTLNIDDDVNKALQKVKKFPSSDIVLVIPKEALIFADSVNFRLLRKQAELLSKNISILTMDKRGQQYALEYGFELRSFDALRKNGPSVDLKRAHKNHVRKESENLRDFSLPAYISEKDYLQKDVNKLPDHGFGFAPEPIEEHYAVAVMPETFPEVRQKTEIEKAQTADAFKEYAQQKILETQSKPKNKKGALEKLFKVAVVLALIIIVLLFTVVLPQANIVVYARTQAVSRDLEISVDKSASSVDSQNLIIPGQIFDQDEQINKSFNATGQINVGQKARGSVQIYNFTGRILRLNSATTFLTVGNKVYHFVNDVSDIKPTRTFNKTDVDPASLGQPVPIIADQPGEDYNVSGGTRFEIHNQVLGTVPQFLFAKNQNPTDGGNSRFVTVVSQDDVNNAQKALNSEIGDSTKAQLLNSRNLTLADSGLNVQIKNVAFDKNPGDQTLSFTGTISAHVTGLAFNADALKKMVEQRISSTLPQGQYLTSKNENISEVFRSIDYAQGKGLLDVHFDGLAAANIDTKGVASQINGKNALELKEYLLSNPNIDGVDINFKPFWVKRVPSLSGRVYVQEELGNGN